MLCSVQTRAATAFFADLAKKKHWCTDGRAHQRSRAALHAAATAAGARRGRPPRGAAAASAPAATASIRLAWLQRPRNVPLRRRRRTTSTAPALLEVTLFERKALKHNFAPLIHGVVATAEPYSATSHVRPAIMHVPMPACGCVTGCCRTGLLIAAVILPPLRCGQPRRAGVRRQPRRQRRRVGVEPQRSRICCLQQHDSELQPQDAGRSPDGACTTSAI